MVRSCAIKNCKIKWAPNLKISFRNFPMKNPDLLAEWVKAIPPELINTPTLYTYVCSKHFSQECFVPQVWNSRNYLRKNAVPTLFYGPDMEAVEESVEATAAVVANSTTVDKSSTSLDGNDNCDKENNQSNPTTINNDNKLTRNSSTMPSKKRIVFNTWTQTSPKYLEPSNREVELAKKVKVLQKRLRRQEEKMESMAILIKTMKARMLRDQKHSSDFT